MAGKYQCSEPKLQDLEIASLEFKMILSVAFFASVSSYHVFIAEHTETLVQKSLLRGLPPAIVPVNVLLPAIWSGSKDNCKKEAKKKQVAIAVTLKTRPQIWKHTYNQLHMQEFVLQGHFGITHKPKNNPEIHNACIRKYMYIKYKYMFTETSQSQWMDQRNEPSRLHSWAVFAGAQPLEPS